MFSQNPPPPQLNVPAEIKLKISLIQSFIHPLSLVKQELGIRQMAAPVLRKPAFC